jgi:hypothetical protein
MKTGKDVDMKAKVLEYTAIAVIILWIGGFFWIMSASRSCGETGAIWEAQGLCLWRRIAGISCILGIELAFGIGGGLQAKARNYSFIMGFLLGFFFSVLGTLFVMTLSRKQINAVPLSPEEKRKRYYFLLILLCLIIFAVLLALKNTGRFP